MRGPVPAPPRAPSGWCTALQTQPRPLPARILQAEAPGPFPSTAASAPGPSRSRSWPSAPTQTPPRPSQSCLHARVPSPRCLRLSEPRSLPVRLHSAVLVLSSRCPSSLGFLLRCLLFSRLGSLVTSLSSSWMRSSYPRSTCAPGLGSCPVCATSLWGLCHLSACTSPDRSSCPLPANPGSGPVPSRSAPVWVEVLVPFPPLILQVWGSALSACTLGSGPCPFPTALLRSSPVSLRLLSQLCSEPRPDLGPGVGMAFQ